ncbi:MAG: hypothetical protein OEQ13_03385 [Acidobacteriota bacterium]|nr:hypothetical protein [Acidobacteriota bacterium]
MKTGHLGFDQLVARTRRAMDVVFERPLIWPLPSSSGVTQDAWLSRSG